MQGHTQSTSHRPSNRKNHNLELDFLPNAQSQQPLYDKEKVGSGMHKLTGKNKSNT
jgi:hypothetical protein